MLRVRRMVIVLTALVVAVVATIVALVQTPLYEASSQVLISRTNLGNVLSGTPDPTAQEFDFNRIIQTQANLARVPRVAHRALEKSRLTARTPQQFLARSQVTTDPSTDILTLTVRDPDRGLAIRLASNYAREFVAYKQDATVNRLLELQEDLKRENAGLDPKSALAAQNRSQLRRIRNLVSLGDSSITIVQTARTAAQVQPRPLRGALLGTLLGLALGIALAFFVDLLDTRLRRGEQIGEQLELPLLARLAAPPRALRREDRIVMLAKPDGVDAEGFRVLRTNLAFADIDARARSVVVTSAVQAEGKSTTAANLAVALARGGRRVILVDLDLRRPSIERFFSLPSNPGASSVALGEAGIEQALTPIDLGMDALLFAGHANGNGHVPAAANGHAPGGSLHVLPAGTLPPNVGEFVTSMALRRLLDGLRERCDLLLVDTPPLLQVGDAMALSPHVDALLLVARLGVVRRQMLDEVKRLLTASPVTALGVVITDATLDEPGIAYGYGYGYYGDASSTRGRTPSRPRSHA